MSRRLCLLGSMRVLAATLVLCSLGLLVSAWAGAVPKPPPKFWSASRCERVLHTGDYSIPTTEGSRIPRRPTRLCGHGGNAGLQVDVRLPFSSVLGVQSVWARSLYRQHRSLVDARHTQWSRPRPSRASRRRPVPRLAGRLLCVPYERQAACNQFNPCKLPLHRRPDRGSSDPTGERDRLHGPWLTLDQARADSSVPVFRNVP